MCRIFLHAPIIIVTFAVGMLIAPYDANSGIRGMFNRLRAAVTSHNGFSRNDPTAFEGRWGGSGQAVIELRDGYIADVEMGKSYSYTVVKRFNYPKGDQAILLEVHGLGNGSNLRKVVYLGLNGKQLDFFGYDSWESFSAGRASSVVSMHRTF